MQVNALKSNWLSILFVAATAVVSVTAPRVQAADSVRIVHVTPSKTLGVDGRAAGAFLQVHGRHGRRGHGHGHRKHRRHAHGPRFITEQVCHRHGGRRHCHTFQRRVGPRHFGFGARQFNRHLHGHARPHRHGGHRPHRRHGRRDSGIRFILNL